MIVNFDGSHHRSRSDGQCDEIVTAEVAARSGARGANYTGASKTTSTSFGTAGYVAVKGGAMDCPYNFMAGHGGRTFPAAVGGPGQDNERHILCFPAPRVCLGRRPQGGGYDR